MNLVVALDVLNECFNLMKEWHTKIDMLHHDVYILGFGFKWLIYKGFYTMVLEKYGEIISVALLRIHGTKVVDFIGTLPAYQKQGVMHHLVSVVEQLLVSLMDTWKKSMSLRFRDPYQREKPKRFIMVTHTHTPACGRELEIKDK